MTLKGNIHHSIAYWCFNALGDQWDIQTLCQVANELGAESVELAPPEDWETIRSNGLVCGLCLPPYPLPQFHKGLNNKGHHDEILGIAEESIRQASQFGVPNVLVFTGYQWNKVDDPTSGSISLKEGAENCVTALKSISKLAEEKKVTLVLEHLNTRDASSPMTGHPGYQGDDIDYVAKIVNDVGSSAVKILFDIYHVQIMNGDICRRIRQYAPLIGHIHTAGSPGRGELDDRQEINYPPIMRTLVEVGYQGFVGHEFIPTRDPKAGLREAIAVCDV